MLGGWRLLGRHETSADAVDAIPIGRVPFDFIERIDWSRSDGYYNAPHFYVRYAGPIRQPYEEIIYRAALNQGSDYLSELYGLRHETSDWSIVRRSWFLTTQTILRIWRRIRRVARKASRN